MENKIIQFPQVKADKQAADPVLERALFFADYEIAELSSVIPQAEPETAKFVY
jgi:hypothetical protein